MRPTRHDRSRETNRPRVAGSLLLVAFLIAGCGTARVHRTYTRHAAERIGTLAATGVPGPLTRAVLDRQELASPVGLVRPGRKADALETSGAAAADPDGLIALADLRSRQARQAEVITPGRAPVLYLDAVEAAARYLAVTAPLQAASADLDPREVAGREVYNVAVAGFLRSSAGTYMQLDEKWREGLAERGIRIEFRRDAGVWNPEYFGNFYFANDYRVIGIRDHKRADGLGVPLIAERRPSRLSLAPLPLVRPEDKFYPDRLQAYPATAMLKVDRDDDDNGRRIVTLELHDPMRTGAVDYAGGVRPLANDLTTPLSFYFTRLPLPQITQIGLLRPGILENQTGLYLLHPYEPGKIPVVLIHGLWSSPDTWHQALNELRGDPALRDRYQFWVYFYPTGDPFLYSAGKLRQSLADVRETLDPKRADPAFDQMVLVGHSMGGLLSRLMVEDSGTAFWDTIANRPFSELQAGPGQRELISRSLFFEANASIRRVIFIATPHAGSTLSGALIGRLGNALIRLPSMFEDNQRALLAQNGEGFFKNHGFHSPTSSIAQLSPRNPFFAVINERPVAPGVTFHSIIAKAVPGPLESSTDLIVAYESSHLDGTASEVIIDDDHACLANPDTIEEIRRILSLHLREAAPEIAANRPATTEPAAVDVSSIAGPGDGKGGEERPKPR